MGEGGFWLWVLEHRAALLGAAPMLAMALGVVLVVRTLAWVNTKAVAVAMLVTGWNQGRELVTAQPRVVRAAKKLILFVLFIIVVTVLNFVSPVRRFAITYLSWPLGLAVVMRLGRYAGKDGSLLPTEVFTALDAKKVSTAVGDALAALRQPVNVADARRFHTGAVGGWDMGLQARTGASLPKIRKLVSDMELGPAVREKATPLNAPVRLGAIEVRAKNLHEGTGRLIILDRDPLRATYPWPHGVEHIVLERDGQWSVPLGLDRMGQEQRLVIAERNQRHVSMYGGLVSGASDCGKTSAVHVAIAGLSGIEFLPGVGAALYVIDLKGGNYRQWAPRLSGLFEGVASLPRVRRFLTSVDAEVGRRALLPDEDLRRLPPIVVLIDEAHRLSEVLAEDDPLHGAYDDKTGELVMGDPSSQRARAVARTRMTMSGNIVRGGRELGVNCVLITQKTTKDDIDRGATTSAQYYIAGRAKDPSQAIGALPDTALSDTDGPTTIPPEKWAQGVVDVVADGIPGRRLKTYWIDPQLRAEFARTTAHLRPRNVNLAGAAPAPV